jgi:hypothetical protein
MKMIAGSILASLGLMAEMLNEWLSHFFFAAFNIAKGTMFTGAGNFVTPAAYADAENVQIFIGTRIVIWLLIALGFALLVWGIKEAISQTPKSQN